MESKLIIEFDNWDNYLPVDDAVAIENAIKEGDYKVLAKHLKIQDADNVRIINAADLLRDEFAKYGR